MSALRETIFDLLFNASVQIAFFAIVAAVFSPLIARAKAAHQYLFYLAVFVFCLAAPQINTLWQSHPVAVAHNSPSQLQPQSAAADHGLWPWQHRRSRHPQFPVSAKLQTWIVGLWALFVLYRLIHFSRGLYRVHRLRSDASVLGPAAVGVASQIIDATRRVALLESTAIDDPVTVGIFHPAIVLPRKVLPDLCEQDLLAILAHEYGHIRRDDFAAHILCELLSLPVAWHPGIRYLKSKIVETRELACDDYAAARLGKRRLYARTLLRLASMCLRTPRGNTLALGIFHGDNLKNNLDTRNLENRIMMLIEKRPSLSRAGVVALTLAISILLSAGTVLARAMSLQSGSASSQTTQAFAGTWHWMFGGKSFATMVLRHDATGITGTVTESHIALNSDGALSRADPTDNATPVPVTRATLEGSAPHVTVGDTSHPFEFIVTLKDDTHADLHPVGAPPNMKPIPADKIQ